MNILLNHTKKIVKAPKSRHHHSKLSELIKTNTKLYGKQNLKRM